MFLSVITRTFKRPKLLEENQTSLRVQTCQDFEQIVIRDEIGIGIPETYKRLQTQDVSGDYAWIFDDDNVLTDLNFVSNLKEIAYNKPDLVICRAWIGEDILPNEWPPILAHIDAMNVIVSKEMWYKHRGSFLPLYEGDFHFIKAVYDDAKSILWYPSVIGKTRQISHGVSV